MPRAILGGLTALIFFALASVGHANPTRADHTPTFDSLTYKSTKYDQLTDPFSSTIPLNLYFSYDRRENNGTGDGVGDFLGNTVHLGDVDTALTDGMPGHWTRRGLGHGGAKRCAGTRYVKYLPPKGSTAAPLYEPTRMFGNSTGPECMDQIHGRFFLDYGHSTLYNQLPRQFVLAQFHKERYCTMMRPGCHPNSGHHDVLTCGQQIAREISDRMAKGRGIAHRELRSIVTPFERASKCGPSPSDDAPSSQPDDPPPPPMTPGFRHRSRYVIGIAINRTTDGTP